jgi:hypothetical protein
MLLPKPTLSSMKLKKLLPLRPLRMAHLQATDSWAPGLSEDEGTTTPLQRDCRLSDVALFIEIQFRYAEGRFSDCKTYVLYLSQIAIAATVEYTD